MDRPLKILHLEDLSADAEMVDRVLRKAQFHFEKRLVLDRPDFIRELRDFQPDIILSDHSLPAFNSLEALRISREEGIPVPFILITATVSEEYAVNVIKEGASDYILKDRLERLPNAVQNALDKYRMESERKLAIGALRSSEQKYKLLFEGNPMPMWMVSLKNLGIIDVNEAATTHYGYTREEFLTIQTGNLWSDKNPGIYRPGIWKHKKKDGTPIDVEVITHELIHDNESALLVLAMDITEKRRAEEELARQTDLQQKLITQTSILVQEREREEIGKELHDNINQILAAAKLYLDIAIKESEDTSPEALLRSHENLNLAMEEIRQLSQSLVAPSLGGVSLDKALRKLIDNLPLTSSLQLDLDTKGYQEDVDDENIKLTCYRIVQVQLNNIIKHARAKRATIQLKKTPSALELAIRDDGIGFNTNKKNQGIGLRNIKNRVGFYNGSVTIDSEPDRGCILTITIPLSR
ncbi:MAG TPA: response regulator [Puia sp.]|jgi:two-component system sensor histidine kinase UhpB